MIPLRDDVEAQSYPIVNILLIVVNVVAFICLLGQNESLIAQWCVVPHRFVAEHDLGQFATMITSMFMHSGFAHLFWNMWFLWIFGDNVEDRVGHFEYLLFYVLCGIAGDFAYVLSDPTSTVPSLGASGAIAGVMGAYLLLFPGAKIKMLWDDFWLWVMDWRWAVIGEWWVVQYAMGVVLNDHSSHIAYFAHLGGFLAGFILIGFIAKRNMAPATYRYDNS